MSAGDREFQQRMEQVGALLQEVEGFADPQARETTRAIVQALMDLHGAGLASVLALVRDAGPAGASLLEAFAGDGLVSSMLLLYNLHPVGVEARVRAGLEKVKPLLHQHGAGVELVSVDEGMVRLRLVGNCESCPATVKRALEEAVYAVAPDLSSLEVDATQGGVSRLVPLPLLGGR